MRRAFLILMKIAIVLGLILIGFEIAMACYPPLAGAAVWLVSSKGSQCNLFETISTVAFERERAKAMHRLHTSARTVGLDGELRLLDIPGARQVWVLKQIDVGRILGVFGEELADEYRLSAYMRPGDIVLDVGADFGSVTSQALQLGAQRVIAIEIAPQKWPCLNRTFAKEIAEGRVTVVQAGAWDRESVLELDDDSLVMSRGTTKQKVRVTTIDQIVSELHLPRVDFITMDIEGSEKAALRGAAGTLRKFKPRMAISSEHLGDDVVAIPQTVHAILPDYEVICGRCTRKDNRLLTNVLWFK